MIVIKSVWGCYWNAEQDSFAPREAATEYETAEDLPIFLGNATLEVFSMPEDGHLDARYYLDGDDDSIASAEEV